MCHMFCYVLTAINYTALHATHRWKVQKHEDVKQWKHLPSYWSFVRGIHRSPVDSPHKGQWRGALMICLMCTWTNNWANCPYMDDLKRHRPHYDVTVMKIIQHRWRFAPPQKKTTKKTHHQQQKNTNKQTKNPSHGISTVSTLREDNRDVMEVY